ncbi:MAG: hypothetical protein ACK53L_28655, partial [Pirellulaceae bacterium]
MNRSAGVAVDGQSGMMVCQARSIIYRADGFRQGFIGRSIACPLRRLRAFVFLVVQGSDRSRRNWD